GFGGWGSQGGQGQRAAGLDAAGRRHRAGASRPRGDRRGWRRGRGWLRGRGVRVLRGAYRRDGGRSLRDCGSDREGQGARAGGVRPLPRGTGALYLPAPCRRQEPDRLLVREEDKRHRLRDGRALRRRPAAPHPDERGRGQDGYTGCSPPPGEPAGGRRTPVGRRAGDARREGDDHRRRGCGDRGGQDRSGHAGYRERPGHQPKAPGVPLRHLRGQGGPGDPKPGPYRRLREGGGRGRRGGPRSRGEGPEDREPRDGREHETGQRCSGRRRGPGRMYRDDPPHDSLGPHLRRRGRGPLLRGEHPRRRRPHLNPGAYQRDAPLPGKDSRRGCGGRRRLRSRPLQRSLDPARQPGLGAGRRGPRPVPRACRETPRL
ncbi:MAG: Alanine dehydrogenase, partial [uncultured Rubrobacteraceae bacterium]